MIDNTNVPRATIEAAINKWKDHLRQIEIQIVATNTVISELNNLIEPKTELATSPTENKKDKS
jgi:hypothetical protein